jgi:hypothetical protein
MQIPGAVRSIYPSVEGENLETLWAISVEQAKGKTKGSVNSETFLLARQKLTELLPEKLRVRLNWKVLREKPQTAL